MLPARSHCGDDETGCHVELDPSLECDRVLTCSCDCIPCWRAFQAEARAAAFSLEGAGT